MSYRIAIGTVDGITITEHFGKGKGFLIVEINQQTDEVKNIGIIEVAHSESCNNGHDDDMIRQKIQAFLDWRVVAVLVRQIGPNSERMATKNGIEVLVTEGDIEEVLSKVIKFYKRRSFNKS